MVQELSQSPEVQYAEPNFIYKTQLVPNPILPDDPNFAKQWGLHNTGQTGGINDADIDAPEAWNITTGDEKIIVGVIDTGIDYNHEDLKIISGPIQMKLQEIISMMIITDTLTIFVAGILPTTTMIRWMMRVMVRM